jgi:HlyD family secretion protein
MHAHAAKQGPSAIRAALSTPRRRWGLAAAAVVLPIALIASSCGSAAPAPPSVRVVKGSVNRTVSATGSLQPISEQKLGFAKGGRLVQLMVSVGQQVNAGQVLARVDDFDAQADLAEARARLDRELARLDKLQDSNNTDAAEEDADHAEDILGATRDQSDILDQANNDSVIRAQRQLDQDRKTLRQIQAQAKADQDKCNRSLTGNSHRYDGYGDSADLATKDKRGLLLENPLDAMSPSCKRAEHGKQAVASFQRKIDFTERGIQGWQRRSDLDQARQKIAEATARREAAAAKNAAKSAGRDLPHDIDEQEARIAEAESNVRRAQRSVANTTLIASVAGTVSSINGAIGEYIGSGAGTTARAPGGAALPDMDSGASLDGNTNSKAYRPGGAAFLVLKNVNSFQVVVPFEESDAALIAPNQKVQVSFDAVPGLTRAGTVAAIAPTGTQIQSVNNYYATIVLNEVDPRLRGGLTAETKVIVGGVNTVLVAPTAAIQRGGNSGIVQVLQPDGTTRRVQVQLGLIGDTTTQILEGLSEGQQVVIAQS